MKAIITWWDEGVIHVGGGSGDGVVVISMHEKGVDIVADESIQWGGNWVFSSKNGKRSRVDRFF